MELTSRQRLLTFVVIVLALVGLGGYLFVTGTAKRSPSAAASHPPTAAPTTPAPAPAPPTPAQTSGSTTSSQVNIYNWLPFTQRQLSQAAGVTQEFSAYYGTYSYSESTASYINRLQQFATSQLTKVIQSGYTAPGVAGLRNQEKQVAAGSAVINSIRSFGSGSITFVVTVTQKITESRKTAQQANQYAVTVASSGAGWQVNNIELASLGNP
jgi:hypothetical protein